MRQGRRSVTNAGSRWGRAFFQSGVAALSVLFVASCAATRAGRLDGSDCGVLDSLYASSGLGASISIAGHAMVDANQFRMRGQVLLESRSAGDIVFEFTSTVLFGHEREDFVVSLISDTLRIIDRERGAYFEGEDAVRFLSESLEADFDVPQALELAFGSHPPCGELSEIRYDVGSSGEVICRGTRTGKPFRAVFGRGHGRLEEVEWPVHSIRYGGDRLHVDYEWRTGSAGEPMLSGVVLWLEGREWRCKIRSSPPE